MRVETFNYDQVLALEHMPENLLSRPLPTQEEARSLMLQMGKEKVILSLPTINEINGKFYVGDGNRRVFAIKMAIQENYRELLDCYPDGFTLQVKESSDRSALRSQLVGNATAKQQTNSQFARSIYQFMLMSPDKTREEIAFEVGMTPARFNQVMSLNNLPDEAKALLDQGQMPLTNAIAVATLPKQAITSELVAKAAKETVTDFVVTVDAVKEDFRKVRQAGIIRGPKTFTPVKKLRSKIELEEALIKAESEFDLDPSEENRIRLETLKWVFSLDDVTVEQEKEKFEENARNAEKERIERAKARLAEKEKEINDTVDSIPKA